tara:strand:+ start:203 stop:322 length:120 start_codon:yes stop_codon:yes gene_type:complete
MESSKSRRYFIKKSIAAGVVISLLGSSLLACEAYEAKKT